MKLCLGKIEDTWLPWVVLGCAFGALLVALT